jgi:hypothetical protein
VKREIWWYEKQDGTREEEENLSRGLLEYLLPVPKKAESDLPRLRLILTWVL